MVQYLCTTQLLNGVRYEHGIYNKSIYRKGTSKSSVFSAKGWLEHPKSGTPCHLGVSHSSVVRWCHKVPTTVGSVSVIPTQSSRPKTSPNRIDVDIEQRIVELRLERGRCAEVIHAQLVREGLLVSVQLLKILEICCKWTVFIS